MGGCSRQRGRAGCRWSWLCCGRGTGLEISGGSTEGVVSHLAVGAAAAAAAAAALGSPSLLLYVGRGVMDLMSVAEEEDGEGEAGLEVDDRPSMLPEHWLPVERCWWHVWKLWGNGPVRAGEMVWECGSGREGVCSDWTNQSRSWGDWIEQSQIARHGLGVEGEGREQQRRALERSHSGALEGTRRWGDWGTGALGDGHCAPVEGGAGNKPKPKPKTQKCLLKQCSGERRENRQRKRTVSSWVSSRLCCDPCDGLLLRAGSWRRRVDRLQRWVYYCVRGPDAAASAGRRNCCRWFQELVAFVVGGEAGRFATGLKLG